MIQFRKYLNQKIISFKYFRFFFRKISTGMRCLYVCLSCLWISVHVYAGACSRICRHAHMHGCDIFTDGESELSYTQIQVHMSYWLIKYLFVTSY